MQQVLNINAVPIKLEYNSTKPQLSIKFSKASCEINITNSEMQIKSHPIRLNINRREMYASMGIYMPEQFRQKTTQEAKQEVMTAIGEIGDDARTMAETQGGAFVSICQRKFGSNPVELETAYIPSVRPEITWEGGERPETYFTPYKVDIKWNIPVKPDIEYIPGKIEVSVSQWNKVNITYVGTDDDVTVIGKNFEKKI